MKVEKITIETLPDVIEIGRAFTDSVKYPGGFDFEAFKAQWEVVLKFGLGEIFTVRLDNKVVALLGASYSKDPFNGWSTAAEQFWFVLPEFRNGRTAFRLFDAFEDEGIKRGCKRFIMVRLDGEFGDVLDKVYIRRGYRPFERTYTKEI